MNSGEPKEGGFDRIIIGIDPGTNVMGYGILGVWANKPTLVAMGVCTAYTTGSWALSNNTCPTKWP